MTQALYAHMNNKRKMKKKDYIFKYHEVVSIISCSSVLSAIFNLFINILISL
jgi:hypothetical protein